MISFASATDDPVSRYGIDHFIRTMGLPVIPAPPSGDGVCVGYQADRKDRFSINIVENANFEVNAGTIVTDDQMYPLYQVPVDTHDTGHRCIAEFRSGNRRYPCISGSASEIRIGFDIFRLTGSLLTGRHEDVDETPERKQDTPGIVPPLVDVYEDILFRAIVTGCREIGMPLVCKSHWPSGKAFAVCLTHDVDELKKTYQWITRPLRCIRTGDLHGFFNQMRSFSRKCIGNEPYWTFEEIVLNEKERGVSSTYFFLKESGEKSIFRPESWPLYGRCHSLQTPQAVTLIRQLADEGHEIGVHGSTFSPTDPGLLSAEKRELEEVLGTPVAGIRQHCLNLSIPDTWRFQSDAGFLYDTSLGYKAADGSGFRWGTCFPFHPWSSEGTLSLLEIPLSLMDVALRDGRTGWDICTGIMKQVRERGGVLTLLWHPPVLNPLEYPVVGEWYWNMIETCKEDGAWVTNGRNIASWWLSREAAAHRCRYEDEKLLVSCESSTPCSFDVFLPEDRFAEPVSPNATLSRKVAGHYLLSSQNTGDAPETMEVRIV